MGVVVLWDTGVQPFVAESMSVEVKRRWKTM
jgi:hypothetical protein